MPNTHFKRFQQTLDSGGHVFFADIDHTQEATLQRVMAEHPKIQPAGSGESRPHWVATFQRITARWWYWRMWKQV